MKSKDAELRMDLVRTRAQLLRAELSGQVRPAREQNRMQGVSALLGGLGATLLQHKGKLGLALGLVRKPWVRNAARGATVVARKHPVVLSLVVGAAVVGAVFAFRRKRAAAQAAVAAPTADARVPRNIPPGGDGYSAPSA